MPLFAIIKQQTHTVSPTDRGYPYYEYKGEAVDYKTIRVEESIEYAIELPSLELAQQLAYALENHPDNEVYFPPEDDYYKLAYFFAKEIKQGLKTLADFEDL